MDVVETDSFIQVVFEEAKQGVCSLLKYEFFYGFEIIS